ncbi:YhgE/Pip domain-containing protein [Herbiconiux sp. SYSU D00978]|uniref:YhgE/Pip domain-containing protein n=1 Tax=Herbiconiux sp. SYSU D00978 TaxID=2812562 RepID=UPI001A97AE53|nr:YhgE/Pip family protein [Herbiconiux sp. SYSU D00978]
MSTAIPRQGRRPGFRRPLAVAAVLAVPLAFAGLVVGAIGALDSDDGRIPAAVVNEDELVTLTTAEGDTPLLGGRQLVTELTAPDTEGFAWTITNAEDAEQLLDSGEVNAVLTIPEDFSASLKSILEGGTAQAGIDVRTDDAHDYLTGSLVQTVGQGLADAFGTEITSQYLGGLYTTLGSSFTEAASGAGDLSTGAGELATGIDGLGTGLDTLASGAADAATGADEFAAGVDEYTDGVDALSSGLQQLDRGAAGLDDLTTGIDEYDAGIDQLSGGLGQVNGAIQAYPDAVIPPQLKASLQQITDGLSAAAVGGDQLVTATGTAVDGIQSGIDQSASGAAQLSAGSAALDSGARSLATGLDSLATGASDAAGGADQLVTGADQLASGAQQLSDGLQAGADQLPGADDPEGAADALADPVDVSVERTNQVDDPTRIVATLFVPLGLWLGALAVFLVLAPLSRRALESAATTGRLVSGTLLKAFAIVAAQAVLLVAVLHGTLDLGWQALPATLGFALVVALAFAAIHAALTALFGRAGLVVSLLLLALQLASTGGLYPTAVLSAPFEALSPLLPLSWAVDGVQAIVAGGDPARVVLAIVLLAVTALLAVLVTVVATGARRRRDIRRSVLATA